MKKPFVTSFWCLGFGSISVLIKKKALGLSFRPERKRVGYPLSSLAGYTGN